MNKEIQRLKTFDDDEDKYAYHPKVIAKAGFYKVENEFICFNCNLKLSAKDIDTGKNIVEIHQDRDASCTFAHNLPFLPRSRLYKDGDKELRYEMKRLETFINWPGDGKIITLRDLANGKPVGNVPIVEDKILKKILGRYSIYPLDGSLLRPIHKKYATEESRRSTYYDKDNWPLKDQSFVEKLVEAGFYYTGISDHVSCFHCGVGLRNWEDDDDPWKLHAIWSASCHYVYLQKGEAFINKHNLNHPVSSSVNAVTEHDWNHLLGLDYTRKILMLGFPTVAVRDALRDQVIQTGIPFSSEVEYSNNPMYRHEISFNLPYPNLTYHLESEYRITLDELNNYEITSRISSYLDRYQTAPLITIWKYLIDQDIDTRTTSTPINSIEKCDNVSDNQLNERRLCKVCMTAEVEVVTFPCHHMVCCSDCLSTQAQCPVWYSVFISKIFPYETTTIIKKSKSCLSINIGMIVCVESFQSASLLAETTPRQSCFSEDGCRRLQDLAISALSPPSIALHTSMFSKIKSRSSTFHVSSTPGKL
nr:death-associated inhibitor of apoptosis 2-like [Penaeus vannamei]